MHVYMLMWFWWLPLAGGVHDVACKWRPPCI